MTTAVKRACDACHRRKVKCDGVNPCRNCGASQLSCTYNAIPQKKGPKGSRAKVISELRETQRQTSLSTQVQNRLNGVGSPPVSPLLMPTPGLLAGDMVKDCVEFFFAHMYPSMPILHRQSLEQNLVYMDQSLDIYCLLTSLCAVVMLQPGMTLPGGDPYGLATMPGANIVSSSLLLEETIRVRKAYDTWDTPSMNSLCTSYFLFCCYHGLDMHDKAWFHLREATTVAHMIGMNKESTYMQYDNIESPRRRRLYWLLFATERAYALQRHRPLTLQATINPSTHGDDPTDPLAHRLTTFLQLVNISRPFDDALTVMWNRTRDDCTASYVSTLAKQLRERLPSYLQERRAQLAELPVMQQWLKDLTWQLSVAAGNTSDSGMSFPYPIENIARDLLPMVNHLPGNLGLPGLGLVEKLLGTAWSLTDYLASVPASRDPFDRACPQRNLHEILNIFTVLRLGHHSFLSLLLCKVTEVLPRLSNPMLQNAPESANSCSINMFDYGSNTDMVQSSSFPGEHFDHKYAIPPRVENDCGNSSGSNSSQTDMNSPFVSSPTLMTNGLDMAEALSPSVNSMDDIVMSPMDQAPVPSLSTSTPRNDQLLRHTSQHRHQHHAPQTQQQQHHHLHHHQAPSHQQQHASMSAFQRVHPTMPRSSQAANTHSRTRNPSQNAHHNSGLENALCGPVGQSLDGNMMGRQGIQRASSFAIAPQPRPMRSVSEYQNIQRANSEMGSLSALNLHNIGTGSDFDSSIRAAKY